MRTNGTSPQFYYSGFVPECQVTERIFIMTVKRYGELKKLLGNQDILKVPKEIYQYAKAQRTLFDVVCDVFNYGYILGIRAERARRKGGKA